MLFAILVLTRFLIGVVLVLIRYCIN